MNDLRRRLAEQAPEFFRATRGDGSPPLAAVLAPDGRAGRLTVRGLEWVALVDDAERKAVSVLASEAAGGREGTFAVQDADGTTLSGLISAHGTGQLRLALSPSRRLGAADFLEALPEPMFAYLRALVRLGENVWIVGDTGFELDLASSLVPDEHTFLVRSVDTRPAPFGASVMDSSRSLADALEARALGGFATLVYDGTLDTTTLSTLSLREGIIFSQRASSIERALGRTGILAQREAALELASFGAIVWLGRSRTGGVMVRQIAECQPAGDGVAYTPIAARTGDNARWLLPVGVPSRVERLDEAGLGDVAEAFLREDEDDSEHEEDSDEEVLLEPPSRTAFRRARPPTAEDIAQAEEVDEGEEQDAADPEPPVGIDHDDPGWELDARHPGRSSSGLVQAPGSAGEAGMFRARPVVRPSPPREPEPEPGTLTLDTPRRKVIIPEAPSSTAQKRTFAEILKERHRFPPVSEHGPTLTPPVLRDEDGRLPGEEVDPAVSSSGAEEEDITP